MHFLIIMSHTNARYRSEENSPLEAIPKPSCISIIMLLIKYDCDKLLCYSSKKGFNKPISVDVIALFPTGQSYSQPGQPTLLRRSSPTLPELR